eukprot:COSAG04_NODE_780_length_10315_cov_3.685033_3_plen_255_part_00
MGRGYSDRGLADAGVYVAAVDAVRREGGVLHHRHRHQFNLAEEAAHPLQHPCRLLGLRRRRREVAAETAEAAGGHLILLRQLGRRGAKERGGFQALTVYKDPTRRQKAPAFGPFYTTLLRNAHAMSTSTEYQYRMSNGLAQASHPVRHRTGAAPAAQKLVWRGEGLCSQEARGSLWKAVRCHGGDVGMHRGVRGVARKAFRHHALQEGAHRPVAVVATDPQDDRTLPAKQNTGGSSAAVRKRGAAAARQRKAPA